MYCDIKLKLRKLLHIYLWVEIHTLISVWPARNVHIYAYVHLIAFELYENEKEKTLIVIFMAHVY